MVEIFSLPNGIRVVCEEMKYLRSASLGVWVKVGSAYEKKENNGISHMVEHMFFKGTSNRTAKQLAEDTARIGGNMNAYTSKECTTFYVTTLDQHLEHAIEIIGDMINNSLFHDDDISKEKSVILEEIDMYEDSPEDMVHEMIQKEVWKDHPLGYIISGEKDIVREYNREQLLQFVADYYVAENMVISIAGNFKTKDIIDILEVHFGNIPPRTHNHEQTAPKYYRCFYSDEKDIEQIHMNMAYKCIHRHSNEKYALTIVNAILGGSENSRLYQVIREEMGLTYSIYSYGSSYDKAGLFHIDAALNPTKLRKVYHEILEIIEEFKKNGITDEELVQIKEQIKIELIIESESTKNRMDSNGRSLLNHERIISIDETIENINKVTKAEIITFARKYLNKETLSVSLVGNIGKTTPIDF